VSDEDLEVNADPPPFVEEVRKAASSMKSMKVLKADVVGVDMLLFYGHFCAQGRLNGTSDLNSKGNEAK